MQRKKKKERKKKVAASCLRDNGTNRYCKLAHSVPVLTPKIAEKVQDMLRAFNQKTKRLVLNKEALDIVRLKSISVKHLALASQVMVISKDLVAVSVMLCFRHAEM